MEYPSRVERDLEGVYRWTCPVDKKYEQKQYRVTMWVVAVICLVIIGLSIFWEFDRETRITVDLSCLAAMFISQMVCRFLEGLPGTINQKYELGDKYIKVGEGNRAITIRMDKVDKVIVYGDALELFGKFGNPMIFVPYEDYDTIKDRILTLTSEKANVEYR